MRCLAVKKEKRINGQENGGLLSTVARGRGSFFPGKQYSRPPRERFAKKRSAMLCSVGTEEKQNDPICSGEEGSRKKWATQWKRKKKTKEKNSSCSGVDIGGTHVRKPTYGQGKGSAL